MDQSRNLGIVLAQGSSTRIPRKNIQVVGGFPMCVWPIKILQASGVCHKIVVSTDDKEIRDVAIANGVEVVMRDAAWATDQFQFNAPIHGTIKKYEESTGYNFDDCTMILGNSIFVRPSWIRVALSVLRRIPLHGMKLTHVIPNDCHDAICAVFRINRHGTYFPHSLRLPHVGINLDIDEYEDLELARLIMDNVPYPLNENVHEQPMRFNDIMKKSQIPRLYDK